MKKIKIGKNMKEVRIMRGLTQENLGEKVHLSTNYIGLIERNVDTPSLSAIIDIANELGVILDYLVGTHIKKKEKLSGMSEIWKSNYWKGEMLK